MNIKVFLFFILPGFLISTHALGVKTSFKSDAHPGKCYWEKHDMVMEFNKAYQFPGICASVVCDDKYDTKITGCVMEAMTEECKYVDGIKNSDHPQCCPQLVCNQTI